MSSVNFLEKLLDGVALQWKPLGELANLITKGTTPKSYSDSGVNYIKVENIINSSISLEKKVFIYKDTHENELKRSIIELDDILFSIAGSIGRCAIASKEILPANINQAIAIIRLKKNINLNIKYIFYILQSKSMFEYIEKFNKTSAQPNLNLKQVSDFSIPIPCPDNPKKSLEIQAEIVRILDAMTAHTAELTAELTARKKQYNYYRDKLLSFEDGEVEWKELGEICRFINGRAYKQPELLDSGKYPVLRVGNFFTNGNWYYSDLELDPDKYCDKGDLLYAWSASFGPRIWEGGKVIYHYHIWKILPDLNLVSKKYLYYLLAWDTEALKAESGTGSTMMHIGKGSIEKRLVPVPSLKKQAQIVSFLDKFDALTASITEGLPREIELREKQYAYYRDLLLSFPQAQAA